MYLIVFLFTVINLLGGLILPFPNKIKLLITIFMVFGILYMMPFGPRLYLGVHLPHSIAIIFGLITAISILFLSFRIFQLILTLPIVFTALFSKNMRNLLKKYILSAQISISILILSITIGAYGFYEAFKVPSIRYYDIAIKDLPNELQGYLIAHISDTHSGTIYRKGWHEKIVAKIMQENVNLIVHTGDIGDSTPENVEHSISPLLKLSAKDGVFYVFGNHENYHSINSWRNYYKKHNLNFLEDEYILHPNLPLLISGAASGPRTKDVDYEKLFKNAPLDVFYLHLDHYPNRASKAKEYVDLQLSGHTHGGTTFYLAPIVAKFNNGFVNGLYNLEDMVLYVTSGAGLWTYAPLRLLVPSEVAVLRLIKKNI